MIVMVDRSILCPFFKFACGECRTEFCVNLVGGVPLCIVADLYPDKATAGSVETQEDDPKLCIHLGWGSRFEALTIVKECLFGHYSCIYVNAVDDVPDANSCVACWLRWVLSVYGWDIGNSDIV